MSAQSVRIRPVHVLADHRLMGEAVAAALSSRGSAVSTMPWRYGPVRVVAEPGTRGQIDEGSGRWSGVLVCGLEDPLSLAAAAALVRREPHVWLVVAAGPPDGRWGAVIEAGAGGVLPAGTSLEELHGALERLESGQPATQTGHRSRSLERWAAVRPADRQALTRLERLTPREREVLAGLGAGMPVADLARQLEVSVATVRSQVQAVLRKLDVSTQIAAVAVVARLDDSDLFSG